ncbi:MAG: HDIG domain-containing protein [Bacillota bacterium]|jgi:putative nucleotidyltransferase with HDIG domain
MERNDSQGTGTAKKRNYTAVSMELAAKAVGVFKVPSFREGLLIVACFGLLIWLLQINLFPRTLDIKVGQVSKLDIRTPRDVVNWEATEQARKQAEAIAVENAIQDASFYKIDEIAAQTAVVKLKNLFDILGGFRKRYQPEKLRTLTEAALPMRKIQAFFYETPSVQLLKDILLLEPASYDELQEKSLTILTDLELQLQITKEDLASQKAQLPDFIGKYPVSEAVQPVLLALLNVVIRPNMVLDAEKLADLKNSVVKDFPRVIQKQNDLIISKGQVVTEKDLKMLNELHLIADKSNRARVFFSLSFLILFLAGLGLTYIFVFHPKLFREERLLYLILLLLILVLGLIKVLSLIDHPALPFLAPVSFAVMLLSILVNPSISLIMAVIISLLGGLIVNFNLELTIFYFVSGIVTVLSLAHFQRQRDLVRSGLILMISNVITVVFLNLLFRTRFEPMAILLASVNGFFSAVLAIGLLPFLENAFKVISPIRLLELSNPGQPLIRRLQIEAPGTYHHSILVANLAEAAAQQIGADSLWVRVGSFYHDIGKIKRPYFFVENQFGQENPHEKLTPTLSTLVITSHVKDGVEMAREHGLPSKLIDIIQQHHGTDLVRYFFNKATENLQDEKEVLAEADFRYEGPKPQTKEAALVMLADSVEAAVKALPKASPAKIEAMIQKIIRERLDEGQFDECNLTLKDLTLVKNSFVKVLGGLYHSRIEYPEKVLKEIERKKTNADAAK